MTSQQNSYRRSPAQSNPETRLQQAAQWIENYNERMRLLEQRISAIRQGSTAYLRRTA